jgi:Uma2 family endonuclease
MTIPLLKDIPLVPPADLGPFRRKDYEALPPDEPRCELIYGRFYVSPSPSVIHQLVVQLLFKKLERCALKAKAWVFMAPLDVNFFDHSVTQPDILYVSAVRQRIIEERIEGAPDLVVEVLSPGTARRDRGEKLRLYAEAGIREYWICDPPERQIEFLRNDAGQFVVSLPKAGVYRSPVLPEISLDVARFWKKIDERLAALDDEES